MQATVREEKKLMVENAKLKKEIEELKRQLLEKERSRGGKGTCNTKGWKSNAKLREGRSVLLDKRKCLRSHLINPI